MKIFLARTMVVFLIALITTSVSAQLSETDREIQSMLEVDPGDDDAMRRSVSTMYLQCAAIYTDISITSADSRPAASKLFDEMKNFHLIVGQALLTEPGMPLSSSTTRANAYVEAYILDRLPNFTDAELISKKEWCESDSMLDRGTAVVADLEKNLEQAEE